MDRVYIEELKSEKLNLLSFLSKFTSRPLVKSENEQWLAPKQFFRTGS